MVTMAGRTRPTDNGIESFVKNVLVGAASSRFHRPPTGQGLNEIAQNTIRSMRSYVQTSDFFRGLPANHLLTEREAGEAYCRSIEGEEYAIYFPAGGEVTLGLDGEKHKFSITWLDILQSQWGEESELDVVDGRVRIAAPTGKHSLAFIKTK
ncbi:MAG: hypothetical protein U5K79_11565 [Cyclobacteriaceae bacterium]|nr:hypothetical protein [Cyclobacteriaceae bacterium]